MIPCLQVDGTADGGRTAPPPTLVSLDVTAEDSGWIVGLASRALQGLAHLPLQLEPRVHTDPVHRISDRPPGGVHPLGYARELAVVDP